MIKNWKQFWSLMVCQHIYDVGKDISKDVVFYIYIAISDNL